MHHLRVGSSLCEILVALVLLSTTAAWALQATATAERTLGRTANTRRALHRAARSLADLDALPCDSASVSRTTIEPRWQIDARRTAAANIRHDDVRLRSARGDTLVLHHDGWCD